MSEQEDGGVRWTEAHRNVAFVIALILFLAVCVNSWAALAARDAAQNASESAAEAVKQANSAASAERESQIALTEQVLDLVHQIEGCVKPEGKCAQRGAAKTAEAVGVLTSAILISNACADQAGEQTVDEVRACVQRYLPEPTE